MAKQRWQELARLRRFQPQEPPFTSDEGPRWPMAVVRPKILVVGWNFEATFLPRLTLIGVRIWVAACSTTRGRCRLAYWLEKLVGVNLPWTPNPVKKKKKKRERRRKENKKEREIEEA